MLGFLHQLPAGSEPSTLRLAAVTPPDQLTLDNLVVPSAAVFEALSIPASDLVANGRIAKFLVDLRSPQSPDVHVINGNHTVGGSVPDAARFHYVFARDVLAIPESLDEFNRVTYFSPTKRYAAGSLHTYFLDGAAEPVYGVQLYPQDVGREQLVLDIVRAVREVVTIPGARLAFVATGSQQTTATVEDELGALGVEVLTVDRVLGSINYLPLNLGEAWGYLRLFPDRDAGLSAADIPVFEELPLDLSVVAGVITRAVQDASSHVNLKSKERGTPNMVLRDAGPDHPRLAPSRDRPVHLVVRTEDFLVEPTTEEEVAARLAARADLPWIPLGSEPDTQPRSFDELASGSVGAALAASARFGSKAANLAFLGHRSVLGRVVDNGSSSAAMGYDLVPAGLGVPLSFYWRFIEHQPNVRLRAALASLVDDEKSGRLSTAARASRSAELQTIFLDSELPPEDLSEVKAMIAEVLPGATKIKIRSSANAEDVPNFDGAGHHDSFAATVTKKDEPDGRCRFEIDEVAGGAVKREVKPKSVACAVKGVYASLWNQRAIEERTYARIDHAMVAMGLAVVASYDSESEVAANAVVVTRVINATGVFGYTLSLQTGNNLVTNPDQGTYSEVTIAALGLGDEPTSLTTTRFAKPVADGAQLSSNVLPAEQALQIVDLAATVERAYCAARPDYYDGDCRTVVVDGDKPTSLDLELKILEDGRFVCKQVREFGGR